MNDDMLRDWLDWQDVGSAVVASAILAAVGIGYTYLIRRLKKSSIPISFEYWRLFGGSTVPLVMKMLGHSYTAREFEDYYQLLEFDDGNVHEVSNEVYSYFHNLKNDRPRPLIVAKVCLWDRYVINRREGVRLEFLSKGNSPEEIEAWINENYIDESGSLEVEMDERFGDGAWAKLLGARRQSADNYFGNVGFLFFKIKNHTGEPVFDLQLDFDRADIREQIPNFEYPWQEDSTLILAAFEKKGHPDDYLPSRDVEYGARQSFQLPVLEPDQELLFLIEVYRSDRQGFELQLLDDAYRPVRARFRVGASEASIAIRSPLREASIRRKVPYGWFMQ